MFVFARIVVFLMYLVKKPSLGAVPLNDQDSLYSSEKGQRKAATIRKRLEDLSFWRKGGVSEPF